jgi:hypothetical protein
MATDAEQAAARQAIQGQAELGQAAPMNSTPDTQVGQQLADSGAGATEVDVAGLQAQLDASTRASAAQLAAFQQRLDAMDTAAAAAASRTGQPGIVQRAELILAQLVHRHGAGSNASVLGDAVTKAEALVEAAKSGAESGDPAESLTLADALSRHLARVSRGGNVDVSYPQQLLDEDFPESAASVKGGTKGKQSPAPQNAGQDNKAPAPAPAKGDTFIAGSTTN